MEALMRSAGGEAPSIVAIYNSLAELRNGIKDGIKEWPLALDTERGPWPVDGGRIIFWAVGGISREQAEATWVDLPDEDRRAKEFHAALRKS